MIRAKLAKPTMEHEEGVNHLWMMFVGAESAPVFNVRITVELPEGMRRLSNLNGYFESGSGVIHMDNMPLGRDVVIEFYTSDEVGYREADILIRIGYEEIGSRARTIVHSVPLLLTDCEDPDDLTVDEEVVSRVKCLQALSPIRPKEDERNDDWEFIVYPLVKIAGGSNEYSDWGKKYRIDY